MTRCWHEAQRLGWKVLLTVTSPVPKWATAAKSDLITRPEDKQFEEFMTAVGLHYGSMVSWWALWNEPNIAGWLMPQWNSNGTPASPRIYRGLFQAGYAGLKAAGLKSPQVLFGETSPFGQDQANVRPEGSQTRGRAAGVHARSAVPELPLPQSLHLRRAADRGLRPASLHLSRRAGPLLPAARTRRGDDRNACPRLSNALALAARAHAIPAHLPIYLTEFGVQSKPNPLGVSLTAAGRIRRDLRKDRLGRPAGGGLLPVSADRRTRPQRAHRATGPASRRSAAGASRSYYAFPVPLVVSRTGSGYSLWGLVRPATRRHQAARVRRADAGSRRFRSLAVVTTNSSGYWTLHSIDAGARAGA